MCCYPSVLLHNVRLLHGSPPNVSGKLRRVVYYTFHTVHVEWEHGPHTREYIVAKQKVLRACIRERRQMPYAAPETAFDYRPAPAQDKGRLAAGEELATFRYPAADYRLVSCPGAPAAYSLALDLPVVARRCAAVAYRWR